MNTLRKRSLQKSGMPPLLKGLFIVAGVVVVGIPVVFILSMYLWVNEVFSNDEVATRVASVAVLDGQRHLTLYRQKMWDAVLWRVVETSEAAAKEIPALHASVDSSVKVVDQEVTTHSGTGEFRLVRKQSDVAEACVQARCVTIRCTLEKCVAVSPPPPSG